MKKKIALIIHGWPQALVPENPLHIFFAKRGYEIISPYLFDCRLDESCIKEKIIHELHGRIPEVIAGFSLGGLIAPKFALLYPEARLIIIASAPSYRPDFPFFLRNKSCIRASIGLIKAIPEDLIFPLYRLANFDKEDKWFETDMKNNIRCIKSIPMDKHMEVMDYIFGIDNSGILKEITNRTIIFSGSKDILMPSKNSMLFTRMIRGSIPYCVDKAHFEVFDGQCQLALEKFI